MTGSGHYKWFQYMCRQITSSKFIVFHTFNNLTSEAFLPRLSWHPHAVNYETDQVLRQQCSQNKLLIKCVKNSAFLVWNFTCSFWSIQISSATHIFHTYLNYHVCAVFFSWMIWCGTFCNTQIKVHHKAEVIIQA